MVDLAYANNAEILAAASGRLGRGPGVPGSRGPVDRLSDLIKLRQAESRLRPRRDGQKGERLLPGLARSGAIVFFVDKPALPPARGSSGACGATPTIPEQHREAAPPALCQTPDGARLVTCVVARSGDWCVSLQRRAPVPLAVGASRFRGSWSEAGQRALGRLPGLSRPRCRGTRGSCPLPPWRRTRAR